MSTAARGSNRQTQPGAGLTGGVAAGGLMLTVLVLMLGFYAAAHLGNRIAGNPAPPAGIGETIKAVFTGTAAWPLASTLVAVGLALAMIAAVAAVAALLVRRRRRASRVDATARVMGRGREVEGITRKKVAAGSRTLAAETVTTPGLPLGVTVAAPHQRLMSSWEDMVLLIAGPRTGKSTSYAIPAILEAPGAALVTSNKRDLADATRDVRAKAGSRVWVFDPQQVTGEEPTWWWDPLSYVTDEVKASTMAEHFATNSRPADARTDAFFEPEGKDLLANFLLAAALDGRPITDVYRWATDPDSAAAAVGPLQRNGYELQGDNVAAVLAAPDKQRGGVFGTTKQMASCLTSRSMQPWIVNDGQIGRRPHFDPAAFVRDGGTLYSLSRESRGNAGALVTALTNAVADAAEDQATLTPGDGVRQAGRLAVPLVGVLDEAANVCRWRDLPSLYSHYGSRGIVLMTILQSYAQGVGVWGSEGMNALWTAANVAIYGGGVRDEDFLRKLSGLIGTYDKTSTSVSTRPGTGLFGSGAQVSTQLQSESIMDAADLAALPKGRAVVLSSGNRPTLVQTLPWMAGPRAGEVRASIAAHDPSAAATLADADTAAQRAAIAAEARIIREAR